MTDSAEVRRIGLKSLQVDFCFTALAGQKGGDGPEGNKSTQGCHGDRSTLRSHLEAGSLWSFCGRANQRHDAAHEHGSSKRQDQLHQEDISTEHVTKRRATRDVSEPVGRTDLEEWKRGGVTPTSKKIRRLSRLGSIEIGS